MESETDDSCYERKDIPVDKFGGDFYHSRDVTTRQLNRHLANCAADISPAHGRPISLPAKLYDPGATSGGDGDGGGRDQLDGGANVIDSSSLIRRYAEVTKFKHESSNSSSGNRLSRGTDSSLVVAKKRLSALHSNTQMQSNEGEIMDDDMAPLLPSNRELSQEELYESHTSLVSSSEGGILAEGEDTSSEESEQESENSANPSACVLSLVERLLRTHPVWFLPGIQRSGAIHLLQGKEEGNFIVRGSSQSKTMAVSVRLPANSGPYIEHYLIQANNGLLSLESSRFKFDSIPALIAHYTQCCDELPVQLCLPAALREAKNRQQLSSLALLGQEFWRYPMASSPKLKPTTAAPLSANSSHMNTPSEATHSSGIGTSVLNHTPTVAHGGMGAGATFGETPTDTFSTMSSFTVGNGHTLLSPESIDSAIMMSPMDPTQQQTGIIGKTSTFKARKQIISPATPHEVEKQIELFNANILGHGSSTVVHSTNGADLGGEMSTSTASSSVDGGKHTVVHTSTLERKLRAPRPTPPNTLNIKPIRSPPAPPARRIKPPSTAENLTSAADANVSMFTPQKTPISTPTASGFQAPTNSHFQAVSSAVWYVGDADNGGENQGQRASGFPQQLEPESEPRKPEPLDAGCISIPTSTRVSRRNKRKESKHYQESDILESPSVYCRSTLGDKISDYEDIWSQDATKSDRRSLLASTRQGVYGLEDLTLKGLVSPSVESMTYSHGKLSSYKGPAGHGVSTFSVDNLGIPVHGLDSGATSDRASTPTEKPRPPVALKTFSPIPKEDQRFGGRPAFLDLRQRSCLNISNSTPAGTPITFDTVVAIGNNQEQKQNSPFYADPADILSMHNIVRRSPLNRMASANSSQRHSEPPKQLLGNEDILMPSAHPWGNGHGCHVNNNFATSLDELALEKTDSLITGVRLNELSITGGGGMRYGHDSSDYDSDIRWKTPSASLKNVDIHSGKMHQKSTDSLATTSRPVTIHQIIAKKLPHLNLSERLLDGNVMHDGGVNGTNGDTSFGTLGNRGQRKSAYDNVEKHVNAYATSAINSAHSDDGTVFSEPWDSSQWDSFFPNEQSAANASSAGNNFESSGLVPKDGRCRKEGLQQTQSQQKVATILRTRSCRDREILKTIDFAALCSQAKIASLSVMKWCRRWSHVRYVNRNEVAVINCIFVDGASSSASGRCEYGSRDGDFARQQQHRQPDTGGSRPPEQRARLRVTGSKPSVNIHHRGGLTINGIAAVASTPSLRHEGECRMNVDIVATADKGPAIVTVDPVGCDARQSQTRATRKRPASLKDVKSSEQQQSCRRFERLLGSFSIQDGLPVPDCISAGGIGKSSLLQVSHSTEYPAVTNGNLVCSCCLWLLDQGWYRVEYDDCEPPTLSTSDCLIMVEDLAQEQNSASAVSTRGATEAADVEQLFGLDENGNIILNLCHIEEQRGRALLVKRRYRKIFTRLDHATEINETTRFDGMWQMLVDKLFACCEDKVLQGHPRNRTSHNGPGESIATYAFYLANKQDSTFSRNISNFIACTKESKAAPHPQVVMRNMRQFMSGMKNYLVKHGEGEFANEVQKARAQLKPDEFLNLDAILEEVMHRLVILPLREHLYGLFVDYYSQSGDILLIVEKVRLTAGRGPAAFGIKNNVIPPSPTAMRQIATLFVRLQEAELPLAKLDLLLAAVSTIFEATTCCNGQQLSADDFLPVLVMVVAHCGFVGAEIEAEYMWGLLQPSLLSGEAGYYLTALCSAVHVLKNFTLSELEGHSTLDWDSSTMPNCSSVLRVIIPDEYNGSIQTRTLPIRPHTTTKEICRIIAHKARITNAQDYGLFKLIDGEETLLHDTECPQDVRMAAKGKHFMIAYKRIDAKIAWPTVMPNNAAATTNHAAIANTITNTTTIATTTTTTNASDNQLKV